MAYAAAHLDDLEEIPNGNCRLRPVRHHFGIAAFGVNVWVGHADGDRILNEHGELADDSQEELYVVLRGRARFELDGQAVEASEGTAVFVRPGVTRTAFAAEPETAILAVGARPGTAYEPVGWEVWGQVAPLYEAGEYAAAADLGRALADENPHYAELAYNVACCESLAGRPSDALEHLRRAIERSDVVRELARGDSDFDSIRSEPEFERLVDGSSS